MTKKTEHLYGVHTIEQVLKKTPEVIIRAWLQQPHKSTALDELSRVLKQHSIPTEQVKRMVLDSMVSGRHQGVVIEITQQKHNFSDDLSSVIKASIDNNPLFLLLDSVQDPHNLGACIRTAVAAGVTAIVIPKDRAAGITETVRKVASGAVEEVTIITVVNMVRAMQEMKQAGIWLVGLSGKAGQSIYEIDMRTATGIVMGGEAKGLRHSIEKECDYLAAIPMYGDIESLNVSVATGVALYEVVRQRN